MPVDRNGRHHRGTLTRPRSPITVVITDHQTDRRDTCLRLLRAVRGIRVVAKGRKGLDVIAAASLKPRILLLDLNLAGGNGSSLLPAIRRASPNTKVILLTQRVPEGRVLEALAQGAPGYLETKSVRPFLARAVRAVDAGEAWVPRRMVSKVVRRLTARAKQPG